MTFTLTWHTDPVPGDLPVRQVYGWIFDECGRLFLQNDRGKYNIPGGKPEPGEDYSATFLREAFEESRIGIADVRDLGYVGVTEGREKYGQVRMVARLDALHAAAVDPATNRLYGRELRSPGEAIRLLNWGKHLRPRIADACAAARLYEFFDEKSGGNHEVFPLG